MAAAKLPTLLESRHLQHQGKSGTVCFADSFVSKGLTQSDGSRPDYRQPLQPVPTSRNGAKQETQSNPYLRDDHLRQLIGDMNADSMMKVQKAAATVSRLWRLVDVDNDGVANCHEVLNAFAKWSHQLSRDAERLLKDDERTLEGKIDFQRFIDILLPITLTVPPKQVEAYVARCALAAEGAKPTQRGLSNLVSKSSRPDHAAPSPRKKESIGLIGQQLAKTSVIASRQDEARVSCHSKSTGQAPSGMPGSYQSPRARGSGSAPSFKMSGSNAGLATRSRLSGTSSISQPRRSAHGAATSGPANSTGRGSKELGGFILNMVSS